MTPEEATRRYQDADRLGRPARESIDLLETEFYRPWDETPRYRLTTSQIFWAYTGVISALALFVWVTYKHFGAMTW